MFGVQGLLTDLSVLTTPDLAPEVEAPERNRFLNEEQYQEALGRAILHRKLLIVRQAVEKQRIRNGFWPRLFRVGQLFAIPLSVVVSVEYIGCMLMNHHVYEVMTVTYWWHHFFR